MSMTTLKLIIGWNIISKNVSLLPFETRCKLSVHNSENDQEVFGTSCVRWIYVLCPVGYLPYMEVATNNGLGGGTGSNHDLFW